MRNLDPNVTRVLQTMSDLLGRPIDTAEADFDREDFVSSKPHHRFRVGVRSADGTPFSSSERSFIHEIIDLLDLESTARLECKALDQRVRMLERENVDLSMKSRALAEASSRDALTGLYARWYLLEKIEEELNRAWRHGSPMSLLMLDLDHFKRVNDSFGHPTGDHLLQAIGDVLRDSCRVYDIPGRYGGEEFCLMLPETRIESTLSVAERIRSRVETTTFQCAGTPVQITTSIGVAGLDNIPDEGLFGAASLIERADRALYSAKDRGRNRIELWSTNLARPGVSTEH